jgi:hypothetical protein
VHSSIGPALAGEELKVEQEDYSIRYAFNTNGFRGDDFPTTKSANQQRLLILGDSFAEGFGVDVEKRFSDLLLETLRKSTPSNWDQVNVAQLATNPDAYWDNLVKFGVAFKPDVVILALFMGNDFMGGRAVGPVTPRKVNDTLDLYMGSPGFVGGMKLEYFRRLISRVFTGTKTLIRRPSGAAFWDIYFEAKIDRNFYLKRLEISDAEFDNACANIDTHFVADALCGKINPCFLIEAVTNQMRKTRRQGNDDPFYNDLDFENTYSYLSECNAILAARKIKFLILVIPDVYNAHTAEYTKYLKTLGYDNPPGRILQLEEIRLRLLHRLDLDHIDYVDLLDSFRGLSNMAYHKNDQHLNELGHRIAADELFKHLIKANIIPRNNK